MNSSTLVPSNSSPNSKPTAFVSNLSSSSNSPLPSSSSSSNASFSTPQPFTPLSKDQLNLLQQPQANLTLFSNPIQPPSPTSLQSTSNFNAGPATLQFHESNLSSSNTTSNLPTRAPTPLNLEKEIRSFTAGDTLDEPVSATLLRDLKAIWQKLKRVCLPKGRTDVLRDWDLWGPLLLCLGLSIVMSISAAPTDTVNVFTSIFVIVWAGAGLVTLNTKLLGGFISFFQSVCVLGYCLFPLFLASIISAFIPSLIVRGIAAIIAFIWSTYASVSFMKTINLNNRRALAVYPIYMFYFIISWMILINKPSKT